MDTHNHILARTLVQGALDRYTALPRTDHEGDALLIVMGAVLEEVSNSNSKPEGVATIIISKKALGIMVTIIAGSVSGVVAYFKRG
jgi:hypothetical protein